MKDMWSYKGDLAAALAKFKTELEAWNRDTFGNVFQRKKRNMLRLEGVQRSLERGVNEATLRLERKLRLERQKLLIQEEILWSQKSRNYWLRYGDANACFFHTLTLVQRKTKRIDSLLDEQGVCVEDSEQLKNLAIDLYRWLFTSDLETGRGEGGGGYPS